MSPMERYDHIANQLMEEGEIELPDVPFHARNTYSVREYPAYSCRGCNKRFKTTADIARHQQTYCQQFALSYRESERSLSTSRLMGS